jgi:hypothetical protein
MSDETMLAVLRSIVNFSRALIYHREIYRQTQNRSLRSNFWISTGNNHLDIAIIDWCKIFGSDDNSTHWKNNVEHEAKFRSGLLEYLKISREEWDSYWASIVDYRNKETAHFDPNYSPRVTPRFDIATNAIKYAYQYFQFARSGLPKKLEDYENAYQPVAKTIIELAIGASANIKDDQ